MQPSRVLHHLSRVLLALLFACATFAVISVGVSSVASAHPRHHHPAHRSATASFETQFMTMMMDHHFLAVNMADICKGKAHHGPLLEECGTIITSQTNEIQSMKAWLSQWYGVQHQPQLPSGGQEMLDQLSSLNGNSFEVAFLQMMVTHHAEAIQESVPCLKQAHHSQLLDLCKTIITSQAKEIREMRQWLCEWYDKCGAVSA